MNTLEILTAARAKIADEKNWCQGTFAMNERRSTVRASESSACAWCSLGALKSVTGFTSFYAAEQCLEYYMKGHNVADFNDSHTHAEVLAAWDKAIAGCHGEGV